MSTATVEPRVHVHRPETLYVRMVRRCPVCKCRRRFAGYLQLWYGATMTCLGCGDSWCDGEMLPRPFKPRWRAEAVARGREMWALAVAFGSAEYKAWTAARFVELCSEGDAA